jgi:hypothetical protein
MVPRPAVRPGVSLGHDSLAGAFKRQTAKEPADIKRKSDNEKDRHH